MLSAGKCCAKMKTLVRGMGSLLPCKGQKMGDLLKCLSFKIFLGLTRLQDEICYHSKHLNLLRKQALATDLTFVLLEKIRRKIKEEKSSIPLNVFLLKGKNLDVADLAKVVLLMGVQVGMEE